MNKDWEKEFDRQFWWPLAQIQNAEARQAVLNDMKSFIKKEIISDKPLGQIHKT